MVSPVVWFSAPRKADSGVDIPCTDSRYGVTPASFSLWHRARNSSHVCGIPVAPALASRSLLLRIPAPHDATDIPYTAPSGPEYVVWLNFGTFFRNGLSFRSTTCLPLIRLVLFSAAIANTSAAVPDRIRDCRVEMYSATGGALENSTLRPGFSCSNLAISGFIVSSPSQEKKVSFPLLLPLLSEEPPQAARGRASAIAARAATVRRSLIADSLRKVGDMKKAGTVVTMADVARSAGVSTMTVSNV